VVAARRRSPVTHNSDQERKRGGDRCVAKATTGYLFRWETEPSTSVGGASVAGQMEEPRAGRPRSNVVGLDNQPHRAAVRDRLLCSPPIPILEDGCGGRSRLWEQSFALIKRGRVKELVRARLVPLGDRLEG